jgi:Na+/proline symporter
VGLPQVGGLQHLFSHSVVVEKMQMLPEFSDRHTLITLFIIPLAVQWWSAWYPGAEPGGGGYIAQRMLAAKNENHAIGATFFFNFMHYAVRPWPWILVALASLIVFPDLDSLRSAFPQIGEGKMGHDLAYPAMLTLLPSGLLGLVLASLVAAYMSTISTHLNWGSSYLVNDFYKRQINPGASEKELVRVGRIATVILMVLSALLALALQNALQLFQYILMFGAGTGLIFILRWFWWRINAWSEITAMFASGIITLLIKLTPLGNILFDTDTGLMPSWMEFPFVVFVTTLIWLGVTYLTPAENEDVLRTFYLKTRPGGPGWRKIAASVKKSMNIEEEPWMVPQALFAMFAGVVMIYSLLFAVGYWIYGNTIRALLLSGLALISGSILLWLWQRIKTKIL